MLIEVVSNKMLPGRGYRPSLYAPELPGTFSNGAMAGELDDILDERTLAILVKARESDAAALSKRESAA